MADKIPLVYKIFPETRTWFQSLAMGKIIGSVEIVDCVINHPSIWADKTNLEACARLNEPIIYNWVFANPILFPEPIQAKGKLSFWNFELPEEYKQLIK